jgi:hypothetical protein
MARRKRSEGFFESLAATAGGRTMDRSQVIAGGEAHRVISMVVGLFALALAVSGVIPSLAPNGMVWGLFMVNGVHTAIHFATAALALYAAYRLDQARPIWKGLAIFFGLMTIVNLFTGTGMSLGLVANNPADTWLHAFKTVVFAWLGWSAWETARGNNPT